MARKKEKVQKPIMIFTLDTETRGLFGDIFRVGLYNGQKYFVANTFKEIKNILSKYIINYDCHIFIHNLDFDLSKMVKDLMPTAQLQNSIFINNNVTVFQSSINTTQHNEENEIISQPITFHDSLKIIPGRLKKICQDFGLETDKAKIELKDHIINLGWAHDSKGKLIKNKTREETIALYDSFESEGYYFKNVDPWERELNEYLRMDCVSLYEVVSLIHDISGLSVEDFMKCPTTASLAMKVFQTNYEDDYKLATSTNYTGDRGKMLEGYIRNSYCGGRTEVFTPYISHGYHYDVNSLYPYVMKKYSLPYGYPAYYDGDKARNIFHYWFNYQQGAGFLECEIEVPEMFIPPLPVKRMNKLIFPTGKLKGIWTFEEIKVALEVGCKINKLISCVYFDKTEFIFRDFVTYFEEIKNTSEGAKRTFAKLMQNSLYGKFGMRRIRKTMFPISELKKCKDRYEEKGLRYFVLKNPLIPGDEFIEAEIESKAAYIQPHLAAYITSLARIELYRGLLAQQEKGIVAYCDTDSIAATVRMNDDLIHDREYGKWKFESEIVEGIFLQPKTYAEKHPTLESDGLYVTTDKNGHFKLNKHKETLKFKGIPHRKMEGVSFQTYEQILAALKDVQKRIESGEKIKKERFEIYKEPEQKRYKFATNLKEGRINFDESFEVTKGINLANIQKRQMDYINNTSKAHQLNEF